MNAEERMTKGQLEEEIQYLIDGLKLDAGFVRSSLDEEELSGDPSFPNWKYIRY